MNILVVAHYYPPHMGGLEIVAKNQSTRLARLGHKVVVVSSKIDNRDDVADDGVELIRIPALNLLEQYGVPFPIFSPSIISTIYRQVKRADVVHIHDAFYISSFVAAVCAYLCKKPVVLMQHVAMISHPSALVVLAQKLVYRTTGKVVFRVASRIITLNDRVEQFILQLGIPKQKMIAIPNGVDLELFHPAEHIDKSESKKEFGLDPEKKVAVFVGRFVPKKGFDKLLDARDEAYQIVFCGGDRPAEIASDDKRVVFLGKLNQLEVARVYRAADLFILPSKDEGFPLSVQEAMASGLPIVTSNDPGYVRYAFDRKLFILLDTTDATVIRETLQRLCKDEEQLHKMGEYALSYAKTHFSWKQVIEQLEHTYRELLSRKYE